MTLLLLLSGICLVTIAVIGLRQPTRQHVLSVPCGVYSPDSQLTCGKDVGHDGWCRADGSEWRDDVWNMDHWADTQAAPTGSLPRTTRAPVEVLTTRLAVVKRQPRWIWAVAALAILSPLLLTQQSQESVPDCAATWVEASPGNPLCPRSPDRALTGDQLLAKYCVGVDGRRVCNDKMIGVPEVMAK